MGVNWGRMAWKPFRKPNQVFSLEHLHPFEFSVHLPERKELPEQKVEILVGVGLHCFTRAVAEGDSKALRYFDDREERSFDEDRWKLSFRLRQIVESLPKRTRLGFAKHDNFVCVDLEDGVSYGVFFNMKMAGKTADTKEVLLVVQSAYALDPGRRSPGEGAIGFNALLGHVLRGTRPRRP